MSIESKVVNAITNIESDITDLQAHPFKDKWVSILGDSISTFKNYCHVDSSLGEGTAYEYYGSTSPDHPEGDDVDTVEKTWWHQLLTKLGAKLCVNASVGGITATCITNEPLKCAQRRIGNLSRKEGENYVELDGTITTATANQKPDYVLIMLGANDYITGQELGNCDEYKAVVNGNEEEDVNEDANEYGITINPPIGNKTTFIGAIGRILFHCNALGIVPILVVPPWYYASNNDGPQHHPIHKIGTKKIYSEGVATTTAITTPYSQTEMHKALFDIARIYSANIIDIDTINIPACSDSYKNYITGYVHPKANYMKAIADKCYKSMINMSFVE